MAIKIYFLLFLGLTTCASPKTELWPPALLEGRHKILISVDSWHSVIGLFPKQEATFSHHDLTEWGYAEKSYYLEGDSGATGIMRALFWPSDGVVLKTKAKKPWSLRSRQPPSVMFTFYLSDRGYDNLVNFLKNELKSPDPIFRGVKTVWYRAKEDYTIFHHCHHFTARALREAGLPIWSFYAPFKWSLIWQLERARKMVEE